MNKIIIALIIITLFSCESNSSEEEKAKIVAHINSIYQAFVDKDYNKVKSTHSDDWIGFKANSQKIVRNGIEGYMETIAFDNPMLDYKINEIEVILYGDVAVAYYTATYKNHLTQFNMIMTSNVRSVDIYKKVNGQWIQAGSNINIIPKKDALQKELSDEYFNVKFEKFEERIN